MRHSFFYFEGWGKLKPYELFNHIWKTDYNKSGFDLDWKVEVDGTEKKVRLLFCPSNSTKDWVVNIAGFIPVLRFPLFYCLGWKTVFDGCKELIMEELIREINLHKDYSVEICGHSYGGAESIVAGIELYKRTKIKADVITFGSPMPLFFFYSKFLARFFLGNVTQYAHWSDFVTYCPPLLGYHNVKVKRLGKFNIKDLFNPGTFHMIYDEPELYE